MRVTGSKWLDRLRQSKGFPAGTDLDLDQFLSGQNTHFPNSPNPNPSYSQTSKQSNPSSNGVSEELGSVLCELFNFGQLNDDPRVRRKKGSRKQEKPRICVVSNPGVGVEDEVLRVLTEENGDVDEKGSCDFVGFSRTQVTVIDTSYPWWKCEKVVFRKKNVWRVRDRKSKSTNVGVKKRKSKNLEDGNDGSKKKVKQCGSSNEGNKQNEKMNLNPEENPDTIGQVQNQRFPRESKKKGLNSKKNPACKKNGIEPINVAEY